MSDFSLIIPGGASTTPVYGTTSGLAVNIGGPYQYTTTATAGGTDYVYGTVPDVTISGVHDDELCYMCVAWKMILQASEICHFFDIDPTAAWVGGSLPTTTSYVASVPADSGIFTASGATMLRSTTLNTISDKHILNIKGMYGHTYLDESDWEHGPYWGDTGNSSGYYNDYERDDSSSNAWTFDPFTIINENAVDTAYMMFRGPGRYMKKAVKNLILYDASWKRGLAALEAMRPYEIPFTIGIRTEYQNTVWSNPVIFIDKRFTGSYQPGITTTVSTVPSYTVNTSSAHDDNITLPMIAQLEYQYVDSTEADKKNISFEYKGRKVESLLGTKPATPGTETYSPNTARCAWDYVSNKRYGAGNLLYHPRWTENLNNVYDDLYTMQTRCDELIFTGNADTGGSGFTGTFTVAEQAENVMHGNDF